MYSITHITKSTTHIAKIDALAVEGHVSQVGDSSINTWRSVVFRLLRAVVLYLLEVVSVAPSGATNTASRVAVVAPGLAVSVCSVPGGSTQLCPAA